MKTMILASLLAAAVAGSGAPVAAQTPAPSPTPPAAPAAAATAPTDSLPAPAANARGELPVDRIVAAVGNQTILWSDVLEEMNTRRAQGLTIPSDTAEFRKLVTGIVNELVDAEVMVQKAQSAQIEVSDDELAAGVDRQMKTVRDRFQTEAEYRTALRSSGIGTPDEYRRTLMEQARRQALQQRFISQMRSEGKIIPVAVSEADVTAAFEQNKGQLPKRPAQVTFRQIIVEPKPSPAAMDRARAHAESLLVEIRKGGNFEQIAKRESMDESNKETGGDLGWNRRGRMVPEFDRVMFALQPGQVSPVIQTSFGFHIIKVDRVQPAEVKARHILIKPVLDSANIALARSQADSVAARWRAGESFDALAARYHDPDEERVIAQPFARDELPPSYKTAFAGKKANDITDPFPIEDRQLGAPKYVVAQLTSVDEGGDYTVADLRERIREQLTQERSIRRYLDSLRKSTYVSIRLDDEVASR